MSFTVAIRTCLLKYFTFSGRASRPEYWWFVLFIPLGSFVLGVVEGFVNAATGLRDGGPKILTGVFSLATLVPSLSAGWHRMQDTGRSGLYSLYPVIAMVGIVIYISLFVGFVPGAMDGAQFRAEGLKAFVLTLAALILIISPLLVLWWLTRPSQPGPNIYGPNPTEVSQ